MNSKKVPDKEILQILKKIKTYIEAGDSISLARKKAHGQGVYTVIDKQITAHPLYVDLLNYYMALNGYKNRYEHFIRNGFTYVRSIKKTPHH